MSASNYGLLVCALAATLLAAACGGGSAKPTPPPTTASTPSVAASPTAVATTPPGPWLLYEAGSSDFSRAATRSIRLVSLADGSLVSTFDYGDGAVQAVASFYTPASGLVWVTQDALRVGSFDGVKWQKNYAPPDGWLIVAAAVSPDGRYAAVSASPPAIYSGKGEVAIIDLHADIMTGGQPVVMRFDHSLPALKSFPDFGGVSWLAGNAGVELFGFTYNEGPAIGATILLNGQVTTGDWRALSADGRYEVTSKSPACHGYGGDLTLRDAATSAVLFTVADPAQSYGAPEWSPDGTSLLYTSYRCSDEALSPTWWVATVAGGSFGDSPRQVADPDGYRRAWYGPNVVELRCTGVATVAIAPPTNGSLQCPDPYRSGTLSVGGVAMGTATAAHTLGIVQP